MMDDFFEQIIKLFLQKNNNNVDPETSSSSMNNLTEKLNSDNHIDLQAAYRAFKLSRKTITPKFIKDIDEALAIFITGNARSEYDNIIQKNIEKWLATKKMTPETLYQLVYSQRNKRKYFTFLAFMNLNGFGKVLDHDDAFYWYKRAAEEFSDPLGQQELACMYQYSMGTNQNLERAFYWYKKAVLGGMTIAKFRIGKFYQTGTFVSPDNRTAVRWFRKSAKDGFQDAQHELGFCYERGLGVRRGHREALHWYKIAASLEPSSCTRALDSVSRCYEYGIGTNRDIHQAIKWLRKESTKAYRYNVFNKST